MGFFTVMGSDDFGQTWKEEITEPATDLRQATVLLRQDLAATASPELSRKVLKGWDEGRGVVEVSDKGLPLDKDPIHWRYAFVEN
jgi:hypothetical protein